MRVLALSIWCAVLSAAVAPEGVTLEPIRDVRDFPAATEPLAIQYACSSDPKRLEAYFAARALPFELRLVRRRRRLGVCHVFYLPTLPGFRALPDDAPIRRLFGSVDPDAFVAGRKPAGDSLDVVKQVLRALPRPIDVTLAVTRDFDPSHWPRRLEAHFPATEHHIAVRPSEADQTHPWAQDYVKAGEVDGQVRILTPRRLFEGRSAEGDRFKPLLTALGEERFAPSKLSWEGGDLQIATDPRDRSRRILFFGGAVRRYWGKTLSPSEFGYVLRVEFGADHAVDLSETDVHADFAVGFLPAESIAVVAEPVWAELGIARAAAALLAQLYGDRAPIELAQLRASLAEGRSAWNTDRNRVSALITRLDVELPRIAPRAPTRTHRLLEAHVAEHCPGKVVECFAGEGKRRLHRTAPQILQAGLNALTDAEVEAKLAPALLGLIEAQLTETPAPLAKLLDRKANEIRQLGFRVVRAPYLAAPGRQWAGVSYVNFLVFDRLVFVPSLGLGEAEAAIFAQLQADIGADYEVTPVHARLGLLHNGGIHCVFGIEREPPR